MSEQIKKLIGEDLYNQVVGKLGDKKFDIISDNYIPKSRFDEVNGSKNELKEQIGALSEQLNTLKEKAKGNEEFEKEIAKYKSENEAWESKYQNSLLENAIKQEALANKARNAADILAFIDKSELIHDSASGKVKGLSSQLTELKKSKPYLFDLKDEPQGGDASQTTNPANAKDNSGDDDWGNLLGKLV